MPTWPLSPSCGCPESPGRLAGWRTILIRKRRQIVPTASAILDDGTIVEMVFQPKQRRTFFAIYNAGRWTLQDANRSRFRCATRSILSEQQFDQE